MIMCKYNYSGIRCANMDIEDNFCIGERNCNLSDIMEIHSHEDMPRDDVWFAIPMKISQLGRP
jgi:hypothetical protein